MKSKIITVQEATKKGIDLYGGVITEDTDGTIHPEMKIIADLKLFSQCIFSHMDEKLVCDMATLESIQEELVRWYIKFDEKIQKYRLEEIIPPKIKDEYNLLFVRIAYIAFLISQKELPFLKAFVELHVMSIIQEMVPSEDELKKIEKNLGERWGERLQDLYKGYFNNQAECMYLEALCKSLKLEPDNIRHRKRMVRFYKA